MIVFKTPQTAQEVGDRRRPTSSAVMSSSVHSFSVSPKPDIHILGISNITYFVRSPTMYQNIDYQEHMKLSVML